MLDAINTNRTFTTAIDRLKTAVEIQRNVLYAMRVEFTALRLQRELLQLYEGLEVISSGRLPSILVSPNNLSILLQQTALRLQRDVSFITNTEINKKYVYYDIVRVQAYATLRAIRLVARISFRVADRIMTLHRVEPLPTFSALLNRPKQSEPETSYFAVTKSRQYYTFLKKADVQR